ncbi:hypothetical protein QZH41_020778 [Actinostola sp. cb2023]|nr:hypothetical protein QZH41_020778 [Actinostola sp. cb2023]
MVILNNINSIVILCICCLAAIPVFGLTFFHMGLVGMGRTTNEQVTGKFRSGHNPFDKGCRKNCASVFCISQYPRYLGFKERYQKVQAQKAKSNKKKTKTTTNDTELTEIRIHVPQDDQNNPSDRRDNRNIRPESFVTAINSTPQSLSYISTTNGRVGTLKTTHEVTV